MIRIHRSEGESEQPSEQPTPSWRSLAEVLELDTPTFRNIRFLEGYDYSSNIYVIVGEYLTIVDPGNDYTAYMELFSLAGFDPSDIHRIVLTHGHPDHAMGALELFRYPEVMRNPELEVLMHETGPGELKRLVHQIGCRTRELHGGETLDLGGSDWAVLHTPGHTFDGLCFYQAESQALLTGDTILPHAMAAPDTHAGGRMDHYLASVRALLELPVQHILPGHGLPIATLGHRVIEDTYEGIIQKLADIKPHTPWFDAASQLAQKGLLLEALYCCDKELQRDQATTRAWKLKAFCSNELGRFEAALEAIDRLVQLSPAEAQDPYTIVGKGYALMGLERYAQSIECFDAALALDPERSDASVYRALALYLSGRVEEALEVEHFKAELVARFKEELLRKKQ